MANSAADARQSELEIRKQLIQAGAVDVMVAVGSNFFYNVTLPVTLWFLDKASTGIRAKTRCSSWMRARSSPRSTAHREFTPEQVQLLASTRAPVPRRRPERLYIRPGRIIHSPCPQLDALESMFANRQIYRYCRIV